MKRVKIGGQAVMEGVMMKNGDRYAVAVRKPDQEIEVKVVDYVSIGSKSVFFRIPIIRGVVNFIESLVIGVKTLMYSASFYDEEEDSESTRSVEKQRTQKQQKKSDDLAMYGTVAFSLVFAIALFMMLPAFIGELIGRVVESRVLMSAIEGVIRLAIFIGYVALISLMKDIQRVFMYHGAEHKTINCFEAGVSLTPENVKKYSRYHKRCGTSFLFIVMIVRIIVFMFIDAPSALMRISYEFIMFAGRSDSWIANALSAPGKWVQRLTTREPDLDMIEVAIASVEAVIDWREYQQAMYDGKIEN